MYKIFKNSERKKKKKKHCPTFYIIGWTNFDELTVGFIVQLHFVHISDSDSGNFKVWAFK